MLRYTPKLSKSSLKNFIYSVGKALKSCSIPHLILELIMIGIRQLNVLLFVFRIRIGSGFKRPMDPNPDPGGQKLPIKIEKS
jgi:hypothetical protein